MKKITSKNAGFTLVELLVSIGIVGVLASLILPAVVWAKNRAKQVKCRNNISQISRVFIKFGHDNDDRMPWNLTPADRIPHYGNNYLECMPAFLCIPQIKDGLGDTPKILLSPCDPEAQEHSEKAVLEWKSYFTPLNRLIDCRAVSYRLVRGSGDMSHSQTALWTTRNVSIYDLIGARYVSEGYSAMPGYEKNKGAISTVDGSVQVASNMDLRAKERFHMEHGFSTEIFGCCPKPPPFGGCCGRPPLALYVMQKDDFLDYTCPGPYHLTPKNVDDTVNRFGRPEDAFTFDGDVKHPKFPKVYKNFSYAFWVNPQRNTQLLPETTSGMRTYYAPQQYVIFPDHGGTGNKAGMGVAVGRNGVQVVEHKHLYMPTVLSWRAKITDWTHVAVVVKDHVPTLYIDGKKVRKGVASGKNTFLPSTIGSASTHYGRFSGQLDDMIFYDVAISDLDVKKIYMTDFTKPEKIPKFTDHPPLEIVGGTQEFRDEISDMLNRFKNELPLLYKVTLHRVDRIVWAGGRTSYSQRRSHRRGTVYFGEEDWNYPIEDYRIMSLIHQVQHCNTFGDPSEGAARFASHYYGKKLKLHPWLVDWAYMNSNGYTPSAWQDNLTNTRHNYKKQPKNDYNTEKYYEDIAGLRKKKANSKQN